MKTAQPHQGRNVKRLREMLGIKQEALAIDLGISQQAISQLEQREQLDAATLQQVADILRVPKEAIEQLAEDAVYNIISSTFNSHDNSNNVTGPQYNFNPIAQLLAVIEENKKLYERLLASEREQVTLLREMLAKK